MKIDAFAPWASRRIEIENFIEELAATGYPDCNQHSVQREAARAVGYKSLDDFLDQLTDDELEYIHDELEKKLNE